jgi:hypothetical protein
MSAAAAEGEVRIIDDASKLTKIQKLAIFLLLLAPENAAQIVKHPEEEELEAVTAAIAGFGMISREVRFGLRGHYQASQHLRGECR